MKTKEVFFRTSRSRLTFPPPWVSITEITILRLTLTLLT